MSTDETFERCSIVLGIFMSVSVISISKFSDFLRASKPTLILPCSDAKLSQPATAFELYRGMGYMSVVRQFDKFSL